MGGKRVTRPTVQSASNALINGYGLALAGSGAALVLTAIITVILDNAKRGQVLALNVTLH